MKEQERQSSIQALLNLGLGEACGAVKALFVRSASAGRAAPQPHDAARWVGAARSCSGNPEQAVTAASIPGEQEHEQHQLCLRQQLPFLILTPLLG